MIDCLDLKGNQYGGMLYSYDPVSMSSFLAASLIQQIFVECIECAWHC